jgi:hypothetical protein
MIDSISYSDTKHFEQEFGGTTRDVAAQDSLAGNGRGMTD